MQEAEPDLAGLFDEGQEALQPDDGFLRQSALNSKLSSTCSRPEPHLIPAAERCAVVAITFLQAKKKPAPESGLNLYLRRRHRGDRTDYAAVQYIRPILNSYGSHRNFI